MNNKILAFTGAGLFILQILTSASDSEGNSIVPTAVLLVVAVASLAYIVTAVIRLWEPEKLTAASLLILFLASAIAPLFLTQESSSINLIANFVKVAYALVYVYVVFLLYQYHKLTYERRI